MISLADQNHFRITLIELFSFLTYIYISKQQSQFEYMISNVTQAEMQEKINIRKTKFFVIMLKPEYNEKLM